MSILSAYFTVGAFLSIGVMTVCQDLVFNEYERNDAHNQRMSYQVFAAVTAVLLFVFWGPAVVAVLMDKRQG